MSAILQDWTAGRGLPDTLVIDGHVHVGEWPHATTFRDVDDAAERSVLYMDANGVDAVCAVSGGYLFPGQDYHLGNDFLLRVWRRLGDRLVPFMGLNPNDRRENLVAELDRMYGEGVRCIKLLNSYQETYPGDGPNLMAVYEYAARRRMLVFNHSWTNEVALKISAEFPEIDFIFGHYGSRQDEVLQARPNVYANIWTVDAMGFLDRGVRNVGAGKFIMGSDGFLNPMSVGIGPVVFGAFSDEDKRLVLGLTQARLLDKIGALPASLQRTCRKAPRRRKGR
jgi:predicted TIM-barrel fold metal-dependent hydrolase